MSRKKQEATGASSLDPSQPLREMYDQFWKQTADGWDQLARNPQFLAAMAASFEQSLELRARVQEMVVAVLKTMNLPTRDDIASVMRRLDQLGERMESLGKDIKTLSASPAGAKQAARKSTAKRTRR